MYTHIFVRNLVQTNFGFHDKLHRIAIRIFPRICVADAASRIQVTF